MKRVILALSLLIVSACSDPSGWILWSHFYSTRDGRGKYDNWSSYESFSKMAECKNQIQTEKAMLAKQWEEQKSYSTSDSEWDSNVTIENESLKRTEVWRGKEKRFAPTVTNVKYFCVPFGVDPRPKDPSTWMLWEKIYVVENEKTVRDDGWRRETGFLTEMACQNASIANEQFQREWSKEEQQKNPSKRTLRYSYGCSPLGINPR